MGGAPTVADAHSWSRVRLGKRTRWNLVIVLAAFWFTVKENLTWVSSTHSRSVRHVGPHRCPFKLEPATRIAHFSICMVIWRQPEFGAGFTAPYITWLGLHAVVSILWSYVYSSADVLTSPCTFVRACVYTNCSIVVV